MLLTLLSSSGSGPGVGHDPERFIEVLGAELLHFEIVVGNSSGPLYSDAEISAAGATSISFGGGGITLAGYLVAGTAAATLPADAVFQAALSASGLATAYTPTARVVPGSVNASGAGATTLPTQAVAAAIASASGYSTAFTAAQALLHSIANCAGATGAFMPTQALVDTVANADAHSTLAMGTVLVNQSEIGVTGQAGSKLSTIALAQYIELLDMVRMEEMRATQHPGQMGRMERQQDERQMKTDEENRNMEVA